MEPPDVGFGVAIESVMIGDADPSGVEACSVANKSGVEEDATGRLHASKLRIRKAAEIDLSLLIIHYLE